jgi:hypothetical protein
VKIILSAFFGGPLGQFLRQATVVGHGAVAEGKFQFGGCLSQMPHHFRYIKRTTGKKLRQAEAFVRGIRMEWKGDPFHLDGIGCLNFFNTPGNEVAPGSNEIGKNLESDE